MILVLRLIGINLDLGSSDTKASWLLRLKRQLTIRKIVKEINPSVLIGFQVGTFLAVRLALIGLFIPTIAAERNSLDLFKYLKNGKKNRIFCIYLLYYSLMSLRFNLNSYKINILFFKISYINDLKPSLSKQ